MRSAFAVLATVLALTVGLAAQSASVGQISGTVKDSAGGVLPGAQVRVTQTNTGLTRNAVTDENGSYSFPSLPVGPYRIQISANGFRTYAIDRITLLVNSNPVIKTELQVGTVTQEVDVHADTPLVESRSTGVGQVIENRRVLELPLNGRQATELILLAGGSLPAPPAAFQSSRNFPTLTVSVAGGSAAGLFFVMDGGDHNDPHNNLNLPIPFPDALEEFKVETSAVAARYGSHAAGIVNLVTKSGGNRFHGSAFEFLRNGIFNARNAFALSRDSLKRNQFGGTIGGPVLHDKLFFFGGYQGTITRSDPSDSITFVPTQAMLNGDFTAAASAACNSGKPVLLKGPFVGNKVDPAKLDPVALKYQKYLPIATDPCGKFQYGLPAPSSEKQVVGRIDYQRSSKHTIFGRYYLAKYDIPYFFDGKNALTTSNAAQKNLAHSFVLADTYSFGPNLINAFRGTLNRTRNERIPVPFSSPTDFGVAITPLTPAYTGIVVTNGFSIGGALGNLGHWNSTIGQLSDEVDYIRGKHQISFGGNWLRTNMNATGNQFANGQFTFSGQNTGLGLADFLVGAPSNYTQGRAQQEDELMYHFALFAQDSWKIAPRLTVNYGLRWEPWFPMVEHSNHVSRFDLADFQAGKKSTVYVNAPAGLSFPGDPGFPGRSTTSAKLAEFAPRVGVVFDPFGQGRQVFRAGYGIFFDRPTMYTNVRLASAPPWGNTTGVNNPSFANPWQTFPGGDPFLKPLSKDSPFPTGGVFITYPLHAQPTYLQQWNLSFQQQFSSNWAFTLSYVGNKTTHLWLSREINPAVFIPGSSTTTNTNQRRRLSLLNPTQGVFYSNITALDDGGNGNYNGLIVSVEKRFGNNFSLFSNYTFSHCTNEGEDYEAIGVQLGYQNPDNRRADRGSCASDRRHSFTLSGVVSSPRFGEGWLQKLAGNWQFATITKAVSGDYFTVATGRDNALTGTSNQRPNVVGDPTLGTRTVARWFNTAAFIANGPGQYGNAGRGIIEGPGRFNIDVALSRGFMIHEGHRIEFRAEAFNALNHLRPNDPNSTFTSPLFGSITSAADPRIMQFALKYTF